MMKGNDLVRWETNEVDPMIELAYYLERVSKPCHRLGKSRLSSVDTL